MKETFGDCDELAPPRDNCFSPLTLAQCQDGAIMQMRLGVRLPYRYDNNNNIIINSIVEGGMESYGANSGNRELSAGAYQAY